MRDWQGYLWMEPVAKGRRKWSDQPLPLPEDKSSGYRDKSTGGNTAAVISGKKEAQEQFFCSISMNR